MNRRYLVVLSSLVLVISLGITLTQRGDSARTEDPFDYRTPPWRLVEPSSESSALLARMCDDPRAFLAAMQTVPIDDRVRVWAGSWITLENQQRSLLARKMPEEVRGQVWADGEFRDWLPQDPLHALQVVRRLAPEDNPGGHAIAALALWASRDSVAASLWHRDQAASFPHGGLDSAAGEIAAQWCRQNPAAAGRWGHRLTGDARDHAAYAMATELMWSAPATAATWTNSIRDGKLHAAAVCQVALFWLKHDAAAARRWIAGDALREAERTLVYRHFGLE